MSVFYWSVLTRRLTFLQLLTAVSWRWVEFIFLRYSNLEHWGFLFRAMTQNKGSACRRIYQLCQQTSTKRWFRNMNMTSNCDVTRSARQVQTKIICHWMKPHENFLRKPLIWVEYIHRAPMTPQSPPYIWEKGQTIGKFTLDILRKAVTYPLYTALLSCLRWIGNPINYSSTTVSVSLSCLSAHVLKHTRFSESS